MSVYIYNIPHIYLCLEDWFKEIKHQLNKEFN